MTQNAVELDRMSFGRLISANIRAEVARRGMKQKDIAAVLGVTVGSVSHKWGGRRPWTFDDVERIAVALGVEPWDLTRPPYDNGGQPKLTAVRESYTAWDSNPEPSD